jgi:hypothetical protein
MMTNRLSLERCMTFAPKSIKQEPMRTGCG